jgi:predicted nucleotidyltransferase
VPIDRSQLRFPELDEMYITALGGIVELLDARFDVAAIAACGTIVRGTPSASSDLDIYVINRKPFRQRIQRFFNQVPAEIFVNPEFQVHSYLESERADGHAITAHMLATGFVMYDPDGVMRSLRAEAQALLDARPQPPADLVSRRYMITAMYEDAMDVIDDDPSTARLYLHSALWQSIVLYFQSRPAYVPRTKEILATLMKDAPDLHRLVVAAVGTADVQIMADSVGRFLDEVVGTRGFFEWESEPEELEPKAERENP